MSTPETPSVGRSSSATAEIDAESEDRPVRERILASAERLFAERGFDRTSTARIASDANVPHGLIFYYFKTKMELLFAVTDGYASTILAELALSVPRDLDASAAIAQLWVRLTAVLGKPRTVTAILFQELSAHPEMRERSAGAHEQIVAAISDYLAAACGHSGMRVPERDAAARMLAITAVIAPMLSEPGPARLAPETVASVIARGLHE
jgi:AcrR family transcriptional regulator